MKKSKFSLTHTHLTSFDMGELVPIMCKPVVQGDVWDQRTNVFVRCAPMVSPPMHPTHAVIHHWFVPLRIIWDSSGGANTGFEAFITGGPSGTSAPTHPTVTLPNSGAGGVVEGSLANYLGVPLGYNNDNTGYTVSALPFRAYSEIWNHFYRDEDLQTLLVVDKTDGADTTTNKTLQNVCWQKDYYTTSRPFAQKGTAVSLPLGSTAPVQVKSSDTSVGLGRIASTHGLPPADVDLIFEAATGKLRNAGKTQDYIYDPATSLETNLATATGSNITDFRLAAAVQRFMEKRARTGSRFIEYLRSMGIKSSDGRLQVPEYLGGGKQTLQFSEVLATTSIDEPLGTMGGHGVAAARSNKFIRFFEEPGFIISLMYVSPKTIYTEGLARFWNYSTKYDYFQPELQFIGQQAVLNKEVYAPHTSPNGTFGYQDRYDELRRAESRISGEFLTTLNTWHFGRSFGASPTLNGDFVSCVPSDEPFASPSEDTILCMVEHRIRAKRLVSRDATPRIL